MIDDPTPSPPLQPGSSADAAPPKWKPIGSIDRRVLGVLAEKAKTTPDAYPMSLNAICTGCNQKSNRFPMMKLEPEDVEEALERLREMGAVGMIEGHGRVTKYRHYLYDWLGVEKVELAVMAELLLRGAQSEGELRGRASRMEPIRDLTSLRPLVSGLKSRGLIVPLTAEGRGHIITHGLCQPRELENLRAQYGRGEAPTSPPTDAAAAETSPPVATTSVDRGPASAFDMEVVDALRREIKELRTQLVQLRNDLDDLAAGQHRTSDEVRELRDALGG